MKGYKPLIQAIKQIDPLYIFPITDEMTAKLDRLQSAGVIEYVGAGRVSPSQLGYRVTKVDRTPKRIHVVLPRGASARSYPVIKQDGKWVTYQLTETMAHTIDVANTRVAA